ncbi:MULTISPECIES: ArgE/DapE family deacylase [unclassified Haladaptatus]|uniref:ArgE/DapE family deacylase n=1 Tax=unclassified Haladaptatus TaxID=2622732 RepID=UPI0023E7BB16|nr:MULTISPECIES: ArgE/DapE family deacylase [unclassified Haladaptatus]
MTDKQAVWNRIESNEEHLLDLVSSLVSTPTVTGDETPGQQVVIEELEALGLEPDVWEPSAADLEGHEGYFETSSYDAVGYEGRENVATRIEGGDGPTLTLGGHMDVVDVTESEWERDPWALTQEDETLYGRGVADMKGGLAAILLAIRALREEGVELGGDLIFQSTIEEEDGGVGGALSVLERGYVPDAAAIAEPFNVPNIGIASAGVMYFEVNVPGKSVHAAWGHEGVNAIGNAIPIYEALEDLDSRRKANIDYEPAYRADPSLEGNVTNINVGMIESGDWPSTLPSKAILKGRVGWPPGETREDVRQQIEETIAEAAADHEFLAEHPPEITWFGWQAMPHEISPDEAIAQLALDNAEEVTGRTGSFVGGNAALDERFYALYYDVPAVSVGPQGWNLHGADEHTTVPALIETAKTIAGLAMDYCGVEN